MKGNGTSRPWTRNTLLAFPSSECSSTTRQHLRNLPFIPKPYFNAYQQCTGHWNTIEDWLESKTYSENGQPLVEPKWVGKTLKRMFRSSRIQEWRHVSLRIPNGFTQSIQVWSRYPRFQRQREFLSKLYKRCIIVEWLRGEPVIVLAHPPKPGVWHECIPSFYMERHIELRMPISPKHLGTTNNAVRL
jgi:hypothetical protein